MVTAQRASSKDLFVGQAELRALGRGHGPVVVTTSRAIEHEPEFLRPDLFPDNGRLAGAQHRLVHVELVRHDAPLHDVLTQAVDRVDQHHVAKAGLRIEREDHARHRRIGGEHLLDADRKGDRIRARNPCRRGTGSPAACRGSR